ncbi:phage tail family protein [Streptomyces halstedii]|uniref:phage distal tail protein n=1 Tax=Streptomyces halstedii TaxID=1944 RepID=UPI00324C36CF
MTVAVGDLVTRPGHIQYGDLLLGPGTPYGWKNLTGWEDMPPLDSGTVPRAGAHGSYPGQLLSQSRTVGLDGLIVRAPRARIGTVVGALSAGTRPVVDELPLVVWLDERGPLLSWARAVRRAIPTGVGYRMGLVMGGAVQWEATDPRRYGLTEYAVPASLPVAEPGLDWQTDPGPERLDWELDFGAVGSAGGMSVNNDGDADTHPVIEFRGPVLRPSLTNLRTGDVLEYDLPLAAGDVLTVDTQAGTVMLNGAASRLYTVTARSTPEEQFTLGCGTTDLIFRAAPDSNPAGTVLVRYRAAYW